MDAAKKQFFFLFSFFFSFFFFLFFFFFFDFCIELSLHLLRHSKSEVYKCLQIWHKCKYISVVDIPT